MSTEEHLHRIYSLLRDLAINCDDDGARDDVAHECSEAIYQLERESSTEQETDHE